MSRFPQRRGGLFRNTDVLAIFKSVSVTRSCREEVAMVDDKDDWELKRQWCNDGLDVFDQNISSPRYSLLLGLYDSNCNSNCSKNS